MFRESNDLILDVGKCGTRTLYSEPPESAYSDSINSAVSQMKYLNSLS